MILVDSHAHLDSPQFKDELADVLIRARQKGVKQILTIGCLTRNPEIEADVLRIIESDEDIFAAFGVHPHDAQFYDDKLEQRLRDLLQHPKVLALGEIGLDFFYDNSPREQQSEVFQRQLNLAAEVGLPFIIHTRDAELETFEILKRHMKPGSSGILHCFSGSMELAQRAVHLGLHFGIGGIITFKKAEELRNTVRRLPIDRILIETDCPYLAPVPNRGKRNEPSYLHYVVQELAALRSMKPEEMASVTSQNFHRLFKTDNRVSLN